MNQELEKKAKELGLLITETEEYKEVKEKQAMLFGDRLALDLMTKFNTLQKENKQKKQEGTLTPEDAKALEAIEMQMLENPFLKEFQETQTKFSDLLNALMKIIIVSSK